MSEKAKLSKNENIKIGNSVFHIQTEYYESSREVASLIFKNGQVVKRIEAKIPEGEDVNSFVEKHHRSVINKLLAAISDKDKSKKFKGDLCYIDSNISQNSIEFFRVLISQLTKRPDFLFAKVIKIDSNEILRINNKDLSTYTELINTFLESFLSEDISFASLKEDGLFLYGFKFADNTILLIGFSKEEDKTVLNQIISSTFSKCTCFKKDRLSVLIVEDVLFTRLVARETLSLLEKSFKNVCFEITEAASFEEAMQALKDRAYDLVICDINLGDGSGIHVAKYVKLHHPDSKVVAFTMYPQEYEKYKSLFDDYISKPITPEEFREKLIKLFKKET